MPTESKNKLCRLTTAWMPINQKKYKNPDNNFPPDSKIFNAKECEKRSEIKFKLELDKHKFINHLQSAINEIDKATHVDVVDENDTLCLIIDDIMDLIEKAK